MIAKSLFLSTFLVSLMIGQPRALSQSQRSNGDSDGEKEAVQLHDPVSTSEVASVFSRYCLGCHYGTTTEGDVDLRRPDLVVRGVALDGDPEQSQLWMRVRDGEMPPDEALPDAARRILKDWIERGAPWDDTELDPFRFTSDVRGGRDWWAFQPIPAKVRQSLPDADKLSSPLDAFVLEKLREQGLAFSAEADPRTLVRRVTLDLTGLPPSPERVAEFVRDPSERAYESLVDELLASPAYGERWGRHWLDVVRFGESDGFERNAPRDHSWRYRDWVIDALNADLPFDEFAQQQIAGETLLTDPIAGAAATGYLVAGVHNTVVGSSPLMQRQARQDELEDLVGNLGQTFLGVTIHCARCHDHKFDPITQREYYELAAAVAGVQHGIEQVRSPEIERQLQDVQRNMSALRDNLRDLERQVVLRLAESKKAAGEDSNVPALEMEKSSAPTPRYTFDFSMETVGGATADDAARVASGHVRDGGTGMTLPINRVGDAVLTEESLTLTGSGAYAFTDPLPESLTEKTLEAWVQLDDLQQQGGAVVSVETLDGARFDALVFGEQEAGRWMAGSDGFSRTRSWQGAIEGEALSQWVHVAVTYAADGTIRGFRNGEPYGTPYQVDQIPTFLAGQSRFLFGLRHSPAGGNRFLSGRIARVQVYDWALSEEEVRQSAARSGPGLDRRQLQEAMTVAEREQDRLWREELRKLGEVRQKLESASRVAIYTNLSRTPPPTFLLPRGDVMVEGPEVHPGGLQVLGLTDVDWPEVELASDPARRAALARWITHRDNPLFRRVIVNRVWHHHFGRGLVETPSDFGYQGGVPSHPELLDWLANQLAASGMRLKPLHKRIVLSRVYRQSSRMDPDAGRIDGDNRWLWRMSPQRLDAETLRDSMLAASGALNRQRGGPGYRDVEVDENNGTTYYHPIDREEPDFNRRTVYRFTPRGGRSALLDAFDCPDPSASAPRRSVTTTPLQALSLLNNEFVLRMSRRMADEAQRSNPDDISSQIEWMFQRCLQRVPNAEEQMRSRELVEAYGLTALARGLFNSNEFVVQP